MNRNVKVILPLAIIMVIALSLNVGAKDFTYTTKSTEARNYLLEGLDLLDNLQIDKARPKFEQAIAADPEFAMAYYYRAQTAFSAADFRAQLANAWKYIAGITEPEKLAIMAMKANSEDKTEEAGEKLRKLVTLLPESRRAHYILGVYYYGLQKWPDVEKEFTTVTTLDPDYAPVYNMLGYAYSNQNKYSESIKALQRYSELRPKDPNPHDSMGEIYLYMGDHQNSIKQYEKSLELDPSFKASHAGIGHNLAFTGKYDDARKHYQFFTDKAQSYGDSNTTYFWDATSYVLQGDYDKAISTLNAQLNYCKAHDDIALQGAILGQIANVLLFQGKYKEALAEAAKEREMANNPKLSPANREGILRGTYFIEAQAYAHLGNEHETQVNIEAYRKSAEESKSEVNMANYQALLGIVAYIDKDYQKALKHFELSNPLAMYQQYYYALTYEALGQKVKAKELFTKIAGWNRNNLIYALVRNPAKMKMQG
jgi:tetratricopeptide (TPR) repeat protein